MASRRSRGGDARVQVMLGQEVQDDVEDELVPGRERRQVERVAQGHQHLAGFCTGAIFRTGHEALPRVP